MKRAAVLIVLFVLMLPVLALAQGTDDTLLIAAGQHVAGDVSTVARAIRVDGVVDGDVTSWSGAITIDGQVGGDVVSYAGPVTIAATGRVGGHVLASGGPLELDAGAQVAGQALRGGNGGDALASMLDLLAPASGPDGAGAIGRGLFGLTLGILLMAFCLLGRALWPLRTALAGVSFWRFPWRALALGLLSTLVLALLLLPLVGLLAASVIGLPLLIVLLAATQLAYVYGLAVLVRALTLRRDEADMRQPSDTRFVLVVVGLAALIALVAALAPLPGLALFYLLASPGLGAVVLSRGGRMLPAVP